ncbi:ATP-grasp domain-containing protein [Flavobacterium johnsoniae]|uniref:ATP-grasp domain-containing protein n=1 Tax=Flavobacterium johnsoniae TaxID=986 RepID=UPI0032033EEC
MNESNSSMKNIFVFPCGSEIGLEVYRSLNNSIHFSLIGGSSVDDHGKFIYEDYIGNIPFSTNKTFIERLKEIIIDRKIDIIYPTMDSVITILKANEDYLGCKVVSSSLETVEICMSKKKTYQLLGDIIATPRIFNDINEITEYPVFVKPDIGYGSRGVKKISHSIELQEVFKKNSELLVMEYLPGKEYTVDCFSNYKNDLLFFGLRERARINNGISVNTSNLPLTDDVIDFANKINQLLKPNGAWFFQIKEREDGQIVLMEVASRFGGSSSVFRAKGINFAELSLYNLLEKPVSILENNFTVILDRALTNKYHLDIHYNHVYIDFDDTLIVHDKVNTKMISLIYKFINDGIKIHLITKHEFDLSLTMKKYKIPCEIFDEIIHLHKSDNKSDFINFKDAIFIDDSFSERLSVYKTHNIPVFGIDIIDCLI